MRNYSAIYGKLGALRNDFLTGEDLITISSAKGFAGAVNCLVNKSLIINEELPKEIERRLKENFLAKVWSFLFYLPASDRSFLEFFLYKYDIYNLKILLALHFSEHDRQTTQFVYRHTPLFRRYAFLMDRERLVDKDILLAFRGTKIFPFLMHTYRSYKETGDVFFLDTVLEDAYYQKLLSIAQQENRGDLGLLDVIKHFLLVHNIIWGMRMHFIYKLRKEKIYYYLVLPLPTVPTHSLLALFETERVEDFKHKVLSFVKTYSKLPVFSSVDPTLDDIKKMFFDGLMEFLRRASRDVSPYSLRGMVAWILWEEMIIDKVSFILYERFLNEYV